MRVLHVNPVGTIGGAERVLLQCLTSIGRVNGFEPMLLTLEDGSLADQANKLGIRVRCEPAPPGLSRLGDSSARGRGRAMKLAATLGRLLATGPALHDLGKRLHTAITALQPDVIHSHGIKSHLLCAGAAPRSVPIVWHLHDFYSLRTLAAPLLRLARRRVRGGIAISAAVAADAARVLPGLPISLIPNTVDLSRFTPGPGDGALLDRLAGMPTAPDGTCRTGLVAAFARWKGQDVFLDAIARLPADSSARFYIIGGPLYRTAAQFTVEELRERAARLNIADRVAFVPFLDDPSAAYRALDVVVHASTLPEPFGLTIAEAMACGRAVIVSSGGGASELFREGTTALGHQPGDAAGLANAIERLQRAPELRERLGQAAWRHAGEAFDPARLGVQLAAVYRRAADRSRLD